MNLRQLIFGIVLCTWLPSVALAQSPEPFTNAERAWLKTHDNTIVVYPQQSFIPFGSATPSGKPQGLSVDYIDTVAQKLGIKLRYLPARPLTQILDEMKDGKADVVPALAPTKDREEYLVFTQNYLTIPTVIVQRSDVARADITLDDLAGKKVAVGAGHAVEEYIHDHYPRIVLVPVSTDELGLQKVVLGEVAAIVIDTRSFSTYMARQTINSLKITGTTDFQYHIAFGVPKDREVVRGILDKGLAAVTPSERALIDKKWKPVPYSTEDPSSLVDPRRIRIIVIGTLLLITVLTLIFRFKHRRLQSHYARKVRAVEEEPESDLDYEKELLTKELADIKHLEDDIQEKLKTLK